MLTDVLTLVTQERGVDEYGDPVITETTRQVFCEELSVGQKEFYEAQAVGLKPEIKFMLTDYRDYAGELYVDYRDERFRVLRTFRKGLRLELTCYREVNP